MCCWETQSGLLNLFHLSFIICEMGFVGTGNREGDCETLAQLNSVKFCSCYLLLLWGNGGLDPLPRMPYYFNPELFASPPIKAYLPIVTGTRSEEGMGV